jgi:hypothetical protein
MTTPIRKATIRKVYTSRQKNMIMQVLERAADQFEEDTATALEAAMNAEEHGDSPLGWQRIAEQFDEQATDARTIADELEDFPPLALVTF